MNIRRITKAGLLLAVMCITGCFSIALGDNVKVSLQLLTVFIIFALDDYLIDKIVIIGSYILLGLFLPIYAGFASGISPTFGFVIGFLFASVPFHFLYKLPLKHKVLNFVFATLATILIVYVTGSVFLSLYLGIAYIPSLMISVVPYIPFDIAKIVIAFLIVRILDPVVNKGSRPL